MLKKFQVIYLSILILASLFIFISSFLILVNPGKELNTNVSFPKAPGILSLETIDLKADPKIQEEQKAINKNKVDLYTQQVNAYSQEVNAYKIFMENEKIINMNSSSNRNIEIYKNVIKDSLVSILNTLLATIAVYVFAHAGLRMYFTNQRAKTTANKGIAASVA